MRYQRSALLASACAYALAMASANAQDKPNQSAISLEEVVVTGSFIKGTAEDSAIPVEVVSFEELQDLGRPSNLDLVKTMSESGGVAGEANRVNFYPIGAATINLRSIGSRFTTVVFNGRRFPEQYSVNTGRFNNISWIPNAALGGVETLKAGGGATYGADAVAGVVNYVTRKNYEGLEFNGDYRHIDDSDGDYNADVLWGKKYDSGNLMVSLSYNHRSALQTRDRDWYRYEYLENPASYQFATFPTSNPGSVLFQRPVTGVQTSYSPTSGPIGGDLQMGPTGLVRDLNCAELGGFRGWSPTASPACYTNTAEMEDLVSKQDSYNLYVEHNHTFSNFFKTHTEVLLYRQDIPEISLGSTFVSNPAAWPLAPSVLGAPRRQQAVGTTNAYFVAGGNPAVTNLLNGLRNSNGSTVFSGGVGGQIETITNTGRAALLNTLWKPFGNGGSPLTGPYDLQEGHLTMMRITEALGGDLPEFWGTALEWEIGLTYSKINDVKQANDMLVDRLQDALDGFGGAGCAGRGVGAAGAGGCQYFNPFSSAIQSNYFTGAVNPGFVGTGTYPGYMPGMGLQNDPNLIAWMYVPVEFERIYKNYVFDPIIRGDTGINLPGGTIQAAVGLQFRMQTEDTLLDNYSNRNINPCPTLGVMDCQAATAAVASSQVGPLVYNRPGNVFGAAASNYRPEFRRFPVYAAFAEAKLPIISTLDLTVAGRYEKFISDVTDVDNSVFVPAAGIKWQPLDWLGVRAAWGKTFSQVNPPRSRDPIPAIVAAGGAKYTSQGTYNTANYPNLGVQPEKGEYTNLGLLFKTDNLSASVDYYYIEIDDYSRTMSVANVLDGLSAAGPSFTTGLARNVPMNCALTQQPIASLGGRPLIELAPGIPCVQGVTTMRELGEVTAADILLGGVTTVHGPGTLNYFAAVGETNSGKLRTSGIDFSTAYRFDNVGAGSLTTTVDLSYVLKWHLGAFVIGGQEVAPSFDGVGFVNGSSNRNGAGSVAEYRGSFGIAYRREGHTINLQAQYVPSIINENPTEFAANAGRNANIGDAGGFTTTGTSVCTGGFGATGSINSNLGQVPAGAGSGQYGVGGSTTVARGFCGGQNTAPLAGDTVKEWINVDLIYRAEVMEDTSVTITINNLLDRDPSFFRGIVPYNTAYGSPLGRNVKVGFSKKF